MLTEENRKLAFSKKDLSSTCDFCNEEKDLIFVKPSHMIINRQRYYSVSGVSAPWVCMECFIAEMEALRIE